MRSKGSMTTVCRLSNDAMKRSRLRVAIGSDIKGKISPLLYCLGIGLAFVDRWLGLAVYVAVALIWLVPDRRVERHLITAPAEPSD